MTATPNYFDKYYLISTICDQKEKPHNFYLCLWIHLIQDLHDVKGNADIYAQSLLVFLRNRKESRSRIWKRQSITDPPSPIFGPSAVSDTFLIFKNSSASHHISQMKLSAHPFFEHKTTTYITYVLKIWSSKKYKLM